MTDPASPTATSQSERPVGEMKEVMPGVYSRSADQAEFMEELKRYNAQALEQHKRELEQQLRQVLSQFRPPPLVTKIALNQAQADERIDLIRKQAETLETAPKVSIVEGGQVHQVIRMSSETKSEPYLVVSSSDEGAEIAVAEGQSRQQYKKGAPVHPSLRNHVFSKPVASAGQIKAISRAKAEKKKELSVSKHNMKESVVSDPTADEAEGLVGRMSGETQYMLKKTAFLIDDSSKTLSGLQQQHEQQFKKKQPRAKKRRDKEVAADGSRPTLSSAGFTSMFDNGLAEDYEDWPSETVEEEGGVDEQVGGGGGDEIGGGGGVFEVPDEAGEAGRNASSQAPRRGSRVVIGGTQEIFFPPVETQVIPLGSSSSRPSSATSALKGGASSFAANTTTAFNTHHKVVELPSIDAAGGRTFSFGAGATAGGADTVTKGFDESKALPDGWEQQKVNDYNYAVDPHLVNNHLEWENEIARHVLSVYASAKIKDAISGSKQQHEAEYVMNFVDTEKTESLSRVKAFVLSEDGASEVGDKLGETNEAEYDWEGYLEDEEYAQDEAEQEASQRMPVQPPAPGHKDRYGLQKPRDLASQKIVSDFADVVREAHKLDLKQRFSAAGDGGGGKPPLGLDGGESVASLTEQSVSSSVLEREEARDTFPVPRTGAGAGASAASAGGGGEVQEPEVLQRLVASSKSSRAARMRSRGGDKERDLVVSRGSINSAQTDVSIPPFSPNRKSGPKGSSDAAGGGGRGGGHSPFSKHVSPSKETTTAGEAGLTWAYEESFHKTSKFRSVTLVKDLRAGTVIPLRGTPRVFPIWFVSTGEVYLKWSRLPGGEKLQAHLVFLHEKRQFKEYLGIIEKTIDDLWRERKLGKMNLDDFANKRKSTRSRVTMGPGVLMDRARSASPTKEKVNAGNPLAPIAFGGSGIIEPSETFPEGIDMSQSMTGSQVSSKPVPWAPTYAEEDAESIWTQQKREDAARKAAEAAISDSELVELWGQLIVTANALGVLCIERKAADMGLEILTKAESWCNRDDILPKRQRNTLRAHVHDAIAYFFYKKGKSMSATSYTKMALEVHELDEDIEAVGVSLLHLSAIESQLGHLKDAHRTLYQFLVMVEDGRLSFEEATPKQLCLVAVAYHNLAVVQLKLQVPDLACKSSQNARRIARLCLSYSNRWMHVFQWTHDTALEDVRFQLTEKPGIPLNQKQLTVIKTLTMAMYNDEAC